MSKNSATVGSSQVADDGGIVIRRLHRMVRHGYRPWLGYDVASGGDRDVQLRGRDGVATLHADGSVVLLDTDSAKAARVVAGSDAAGFDAVFPPNTPNRRNIMRRLYEIGFLGR